MMLCELCGQGCEMVSIFSVVFDALNISNMETCAERIKANGKQFQGAVCYSLTDVRMGGEVYNLKYFVTKAKNWNKWARMRFALKT